MKIKFIKIETDRNIPAEIDCSEDWVYINGETVCSMADIPALIKILNLIHASNTKDPAMPQSNYNAIKAMFDKYDAVYDGISNDIADLKEASGETFQSARKDLKQILRSTQPDDLGNVELTDNEAADVQAAQALLYSDRYRRWL